MTKNELSIRERPLYKIVLWGALIICLLALWKMAPTLTDPEYIPIDDFVRFWAAGRLNLNGKNPYDLEESLRMQNEAGGQISDEDVISLMLNPPWTLAIVMPFGAIDYPLSRVAWLLFSITIVLICSERIWRLYGGPAKYKWLTWIIAFTFAPTISVLEKGQITPFIFLGIVGFIEYLHSRNILWLAGVSLAFATIKPQLLLVFWFAILIWVLLKRQWIVLLGCTMGIVVGSLITVAFNPSVFQQYFEAITTYPTSDWATPTFGAYLRILFGIDKFWLQFIPPLLGLIWLIPYMLNRSYTWSWLRAMPLVLLVSLTTAAYAWTYDQVILILAILQAFIWFLSDRFDWKVIILLFIYLALNLLDLFLHRRLDDFWFVWLAPSLLIWYLIARYHHKRLNSHEILNYAEV
jgi:hypothetical protein